MHKLVVPILATACLSAVGVLGDYLLKLASRSDRAFASPAFFLGVTLYASTAFGWVIALRHLKLAAVGAIYCISTVLLLTIIGRWSFAEHLSHSEVAGVVLAIASFFLLVRFT